VRRGPNLVSHSSWQDDRRGRLDCRGASTGSLARSGRRRQRAGSVPRLPRWRRARPLARHRRSRRRTARSRAATRAGHPRRTALNDLAEQCSPVTLALDEFEAVQSQEVLDASPSSSITSRPTSTSSCAPGASPTCRCPGCARAASSLGNPVGDVDRAFGTARRAAASRRSCLPRAPRAGDEERLVGAQLQQRPPARTRRGALRARRAQPEAEEAPGAPPWSALPPSPLSLIGRREAGDTARQAPSRAGPL
jgi:hypothetical protein